MDRIEEAAKAVIDPTVDSATRSAASKYLEEWGATDDSWEVYPTWLSSSTSIGTKLLSLQLLQTKIRKQIPYQSQTVPPFLQELRVALEAIASTATEAPVVRKPCCICLAALMIRLTPISQLCNAILASLNPISIRILESIPTELTAVADLTTTAVSAELHPEVDAVLAALLPMLQQQDELAIAALHSWVEVALIPPSQLMSSNVLPALLHCLTSSTLDTQHAALALQESLLIPTDSCTESREAACALIATAVPHWNYEDVWTCQLLSTFCTEEIDLLVVQPAVDILQLLLKLQRHIELTARTAILEVWLTVSTKPVQQRHQNWRHALYQQITVAVLETVSMDDDPDDQVTYRRDVKDVLVACYYILGAEYFSFSVQAIPRTPGPAFFCLAAVAADAVSEDLSLLQRYNLPTTKLPPCHEKAEYLGAYAKLWARQCSATEIFAILQYLGQAQAAKSIQAVLVRCARVIGREPESLARCVRWLTETALRMKTKDGEGDHDAVGWVMQGCARTGVNVRVVMLPAIQEFADWNDPSTVERSLVALQVILQFCDEPDGLVPELRPLMEKVSDEAARSHREVYLERWLSVEQQIMKSASGSAASHLPYTMSRVNAAFAMSHNPACLDYYTVAVESMGSSNVDSFLRLLDQVANEVFETLSKYSPAALPGLVKSFFDLNQRYLLFCPVALATCPQFSAICHCAVQCLEACGGERESSRSILNFLTKLFGWRSLPGSTTLPSYAQVLDDELARLGAQTVSLCIATLLSGSQALSSPSTDCIVAVVSITDPQKSALWLQSACLQCPRELVEQVIQLLLRFARDGSSKSRAKMLLVDFSMVQKGEIPKESLVGYSL